MVIDAEDSQGLKITNLKTKAVLFQDGQTAKQRFR